MRASAFFFAMPIWNIAGAGNRTDSRLQPVPRADNGVVMCRM